LNIGSQKVLSVHKLGPVDMQLLTFLIMTGTLKFSYQFYTKSMTHCQFSTWSQMRLSLTLVSIGI